MQCPRCNHQLEEGATFCGNCGAQIAPVRAPGATVGSEDLGGSFDNETVLSQRSLAAATIPPRGSGYTPSSNPGGPLSPFPPIPDPNTTPSPARNSNVWRIVAIGVLVLLVVAGGTVTLVSLLHVGGGSSGGSPSPVAANPISGQAFFVDSQNGPGHTDALTVSMNGLSAPAASSHYSAWMVNTDGEQFIPLGALTHSGQNYQLTYGGDGRGGGGTNLVGAANKVEITLEQGNGNVPTSKVLASGTLPTLALVHIRHLLFSFPTTPHQIGLLVGLRNQAQTLNVQASALKIASPNGNIFFTQCEAQSIIDIIEGSHGRHYQPLPNQCMLLNVTVTGDGFGILGNNGYANTAARHAALAATQTDSTLNIQTHAKHVEISTTNISGWLATVDQDAVNLLANPRDTSKVNEIALLCDHAYNGVDINHNEQVDPIPGEAGALTAYVHGQLMAAIPLS